MRTAGSAAFLSGPSLHLILSLCLHSHGGTPLGPRGNTFATSLARRYREQQMDGTFTPIQSCEESIPFQGIRTTYCVLPSRVGRRKGNRSFTLPAETFLGGNSSITTRPESHWEVRCGTTALRSSYNHFPVGER